MLLQSGSLVYCLGPLLCLPVSMGLPVMCLVILPVRLRLTMQGASKNEEWAGWESSGCKGGQGQPHK